MRGAGCSKTMAARGCRGAALSLAAWLAAGGGCSDRPLRGGDAGGPPFDPDAARQALADAGYPGGAGFPDVTMITGGSVYEAAIRDGIERELGIQLTAEEMPFDEYSRRLDTDTPAIWSLGWSAQVNGVDLGPPVLIDGYANGSYVAPAVVGTYVEAMNRPPTLLSG